MAGKFNDCATSILIFDNNPAIWAIHNGIRWNRPPYHRIRADLCVISNRYVAKQFGSWPNIDVVADPRDTLPTLSDVYASMKPAVVTDFGSSIYDDASRMHNEKARSGGDLKGDLHAVTDAKSPG